MSKQVLTQLVLLRSDETFTFDVRLLPKEFDEKVAKLNFPALGAELNVTTRNSSGSLSSLGWPWTTATGSARTN